MCQYNKMFSHVYVEKGVAEHPRTKQILEKLNNTTVIEIDHYKDVFCRKKQSISAQSNAKALILAENTYRTDFFFRFPHRIACIKQFLVCFFCCRRIIVP